MKNFAKHFKKLSIILCLIPSSYAHAEFRHFNEWSTKEKSLFLAYNTAAYIDHRQTRVGLRNGYREMNPLYGHAHRDKSAAINLLISGTAYYLVGSYEEDALQYPLLALALSRTAVVVHNDSVGISWRVAF
jgi:hypothetical protein